MLRIAILLAIALRIVLILLLGNLGRPNVFRVDDSATYIAGAQSRAARGEFLDGQSKPEIFRTPGYPSVLAPFMALEAPDSAIVAMNIVFAVLIVIVTWRIARQLFGDDRVAGICALIVAIEPTMMLWSMEPNGDIYPCVLQIGTFQPKNAFRDGVETAWQHASNHSCFDCYNTWLNENRGIFDLHPAILKNFWSNYLRAGRVVSG
jgi:hypothetical protein